MKLFSRSVCLWFRNGRSSARNGWRSGITGKVNWPEIGHFGRQTGYPTIRLLKAKCEREKILVDKKPLSSWVRLISWISGEHHHCWSPVLRRIGPKRFTRRADKLTNTHTACLAYQNLFSLSFRVVSSGCLIRFAFNLYLLALIFLNALLRCLLGCWR